MIHLVLEIVSVDAVFALMPQQIRMGEHDHCGGGLS